MDSTRRQYAALVEHTGHNLVVGFEDGYSRTELFVVVGSVDSVARVLV